MAKSQVVTLRGKSSWARLFEEDRDMYEFNEDTRTFDKPSSTEGTYSITLALDFEEYRKLKKSGSLAAKHSKEDESGLEVVRFKRPHLKIGKGGKVLDFASGAPKVKNAAGQPWDKESDGAIGNDSDVEVDVVVYETKFSPGTRLEEVRVINLVKYDPDEADESSKEKEVSF